MILSVIQASGGAVSKVFIIASVGYFSVLYPKKNPIIPVDLVGKVSRIAFNLFCLPLIYSTIAKTVSLDTLSYLWIVLVSGIAVVATSFGTATLLGYLPYFRIKNKVDFEALRIAVAFPNIVALPVLIFPALCEHEVVYDAFSELDNKETATADELYDDCVDQSNQMIFVYFFAWSLMFWIIGNQLLISAGQERQNISASRQELENISVDEATIQSSRRTIKHSVVNGLKAVIESSGFIAMTLGFLTASITPLQSALFETGGGMRFIGSSLESLADASPSFGTVIVAASLIRSPLKVDHCNDDDQIVNISEEAVLNGEGVTGRVERVKRSLGYINVKSTCMEFLKMVSKAVNSPSLNMHLWFITSRLILSPAIICAFLIALDCSGALHGINPLVKMVILVNAAVPGALIVVIVLKTRELTETASVVAEIYLPSYIISVFSLAFWVSIGLMISIPDDDGHSFCHSRI